VSTDQEYDAHVDMADEQDPNEAMVTSPTYSQYGNQLSPQQRTTAQEQQQQQQTGNGGSGFGPMTQQLLDPFDPMLDMDPFGLSASMHFPTQFSFDTSSMR